MESLEFLELFKDFFVLIIIGICLCIGYVLKNLVTTDMINKFIPLIMAVLGVILNLWIAGWIMTPEVLLSGLVSGLASTGTYEAIKNVINTVKKIGTAKDDVKPHDLE